MLLRTQKCIRPGMSYPYQQEQLVRKKSVQKNYEFLQGYDSIILWFDNDPAGRQEAAESRGQCLTTWEGIYSPSRGLQGHLRRIAGERSCCN